ncbi:MAG: FtsL-like putative cell division protein [Prevotella sp.]|nr:FtsL-like putative cell division protein [Prevotella sp.]MDY5492053.1 FtsL-like putative cell division protein [Prevotella sp.]
MTPHKDNKQHDKQLEALLKAAMAGYDDPAPEEGQQSKTANGNAGTSGDADAKGDAGTSGGASSTSKDRDNSKDHDSKSHDSNAQKPADSKKEKDGNKPQDSTKPQDGNKSQDSDKPQDDDNETGPLKSFAEMVKERATEGDSKPNAATNLRSIINGDMLNAKVVRNQIGVFFLITFFVFIYISNRYACQRNLVKINKLTKELTDAKFRALSSTSELTEKSRESRVLDMLRACQDSTLHIASQPPYIITVPKEE